jgi:GT2 family glycosyltransferase
VTQAPVLWVVVVTWNNADEIRRCLEDLQRQSYAALHVIVIDNGSTDGTVDAIRSQFADVALIALKHNYGFARAVNLGIQRALQGGADYVLLLNPDTHLESNVLAGLASPMRARPRLGISSPKIYLRDNTTRLWGIGGTVDSGGVRFIGMEQLDAPYYESVRLNFVLGCAMLIRAQVFRDIGLVDERFFVFYEEIDFCLRAQAAGWDIALIPSVHIHHEGGTSTKGKSEFRWFHLARSRMVFLRKHRRRFQLLRVLARELRNSGGTLLQMTARGRFRSIRGLVQGTTAGMTATVPDWAAPSELAARDARSV